MAEPGLLNPREALERSGDPRFAPSTGGAPTPQPKNWDALSLLWRNLPPAARQHYGSLAAFAGEMSPGAAVRDTLQESGEMMHAGLEGRGWDAAGHGAGLLAAAAGVVPGGRLAGKAAKEATRAVPAADRMVALGHNMPPPEYALRKTEVFPQLAQRYPEVGPPVMKFDKKKQKEYLGKQLTPEALEVQKNRALIQKDIDEGKYTPYFDPAKRFDADPSKYDPRMDTTAIRMKKADAQAKYDKIANDPEAIKRLDAAYDQGSKQIKDAGNWYMMGQLEKSFIDEYGPTTGRLMFKERFADAMAATTGGADPTSNLLTATYGNYLKARGEAFPADAHQVPYPVGGGKYGVMPNLEQYDKMIMQGQGIDPLTNPKRYNFSGNFLGNRKGSTIDEQMMGLIQPGTASPPKGSYGHYEGAVADRAAARGVDPVDYQEVGWAGKKDMDTPGGYKAQPMIQNVNESIERTSRLTGLTPDEVVRRGLVRGEIPMYSVGGLVGAGALGAGAIGGGGLLSGPQEDRQQY